MLTLKTVGEVAAASEFGKCLRFDTLLKTAPHHWPAWGIDMDPNDPDVKKAAIDGYAVEWTKTGPEHHAAVAEGAKRSGLGDANRLMNRRMAELLVAASVDLPKKLQVADLGCGPGGSSIELFKAFKDYTLVHSVQLPAEFCMLDPSTTVFSADDNLHNEGFSGKVHCIGNLIEQWLPSANLWDVDIVLFGASIHHMNVGMVLRTLREKLPKGALIGIAEWCNGMLRSPANMRVLIGVLDNTIEPGILTKFDSLFPTDRQERAEAINACPPGELAAMLTMAGGFWPNHALACKRNGIQPMFSPFEGHQTVRDWLVDFKQHGFECLKYESLNPDNEVNTVFILKNP